jgi:hypothetical protein
MIEITNWKKFVPLLLIIALTGGIGFWQLQKNYFEKDNDFVIEKKDTMEEMKNDLNEMTSVQAKKAEAFQPPAVAVPSMEIIKTKGCVADGLLNGYGDDTEQSIALINRSECQYLHRAVETWLEAPNFQKIKRNKDLIVKKDMIYGMFIAEAIDTKAEMYYPAEDRNFDFDRMCRPGTKNDWGEHTCKPTLEREEYRKYVRYITEQAMDMGIQSFMFGQVFYQDSSDPSRSFIPQIIQEMREHASFLGIQIVVGAQTNDITDEKYLKNFDYIEGGVGLGNDGTVENGPCFSRWYSQPGDWCWALLWHQRYASKANNVLLHLDWSGRRGDDMSTYTLMTQEARARTLKYLYNKFVSQGNGFLMPMLATLPKENGGCYGPKKRFYSADNQYRCKDEDVINDLMKKVKLGSSVRQ